MLSKSSPIGGRPNGPMSAQTRPDTSELAARSAHPQRHPPRGYPEDRQREQPRDQAIAHTAHISPQHAAACAAAQTGPGPTAHQPTHAGPHHGSDAGNTYRRDAHPTPPTPSPG